MVKHTLLWDKYVVNKNHWVDKKPLPVQSKVHHSAFIFLFVLSVLLLTRSLHPKRADMVYQFTPLCTATTCFYLSLQMDE